MKLFRVSPGKGDPVEEQHQSFLPVIIYSGEGAAPADHGEISIDGIFDDWRNRKGIADAAGDYVNYLYPNPDTDILEFKVDHDENYLYFYSRVPIYPLSASRSGYHLPRAAPVFFL